jgi:hypothetical protein
MKYVSALNTSIHILCALFSLKLFFNEAGYIIFEDQFG